MSHSGPCHVAILKRALRGFVSAYGAQAVLAVVLNAVKGRSLPSGLVSESVLRLAGVVGGVCTLNTVTRCGLRRLRGTDGRSNSAIAGAVAGLALLADRPGRHSGVAVYLLCRGLYTVCMLCVVCTSFGEVSVCECVCVCVCMYVGVKDGRASG